MTSARDAVLTAVRQALKRDDSARDEKAIARAHAEAVAGPTPHQTWTEPDAERFLTRFERASGTWQEIPKLAAIPDAVTTYLDGAGKVRLRTTSHPDIRALRWPADWETAEGPEGAADWPVAISRAYAGIAETGSIVMPGSPQRPTSLNFLPDVQILVLRRVEIVDTMEAAWERLLIEGPLPRAVNIITGPSRTADVEQTLQLGAHGPRRLHLLLLD